MYETLILKLNQAAPVNIKVTLTNFPQFLILLKYFLKLVFEPLRVSLDLVFVQGHVLVEGQVLFSF